MQKVGVSQVNLRHYRKLAKSHTTDAAGPGCYMSLTATQWAFVAPTAQQCAKLTAVASAELHCVVKGPGADIVLSDKDQ